MDSVIDATLLKRMIGQPCWYVSGGSGTVPSFELVLGDRIPRATPLSNPKQEGEFRQFGGSVELFVWSSWRIQSGQDVEATSDQGLYGVDRCKALLRGKNVLAVNCEPPAWDLRITFSGNLTLVTFSDHAEPGGSFPQNWELNASGAYLCAGPGSRWQSKPT